MSTSVFFTGTVSEAIALSRQKKCPLVIFLKGEDEASTTIEAAFSSETFTPVVRTCTTLVLEDNLESSDDPRYQNGRMFRQLFPVNQLPAVFLLGIDGVALFAWQGPITDKELLKRLMRGIITFKTTKENHSQPQTRTELRSQSSEGPSTSAPSPQPPAQDRPIPPSNQPSQPRGLEQQKPVPPKSEASSSTPPKPSLPKQDVEKRDVQVRRKKKAPPPPPVYTTAVIRIILTNEDVIQHEFPADATIREIFSYIDVHRSDGGAPYVLEMMYPRRALGENDFARTLKELDLLPRSSLRLALLQSGGELRSSTSDQSESAGWLSSIYSGIGSIAGYLGSFLYSGDQAETTRSTSHRIPQ